MWNTIEARLRGRTPLELSRLVAKSVAQAVRRQLPDRRAARALDRAFDRRYGTDTSAEVRLHALGFADDVRASCNHYQASSTTMLTDPVRALGIDPAEWHFIDYGAGKGRVVMVAAELGFASATGVELSAPLCAIAEDNFRRFAAARPECATPEIACIDATSYEPRGDRLLVYFYNPFDAALMARTLDRLERVPASAMQVIYANPVHAEVFDRPRWRVDRPSDDTLFATRLAG